MWRFLLLLTCFVTIKAKAEPSYYTNVRNASLNIQQPKVARSNTANVIYSIDFSKSQEGWTTIDKSTTPGKTWKFVSGNMGYYDYGQYYDCVSMDKDFSGGTANDYYVSPALTLSAGKYTVKTFVAGNDGVTVSLQMGTKADDASSFHKLADLKPAGSYDPNMAETHTVTIEDDGTYHLAFLGTTTAFNPNVPYLFSFEIAQEDSPQTPATPLPYAVDFGESQEGWTTLDMSTKPGKSWIYSSKGYYDQGKYWPSVTLDKDYADLANDYYVSPAFILTAGKYTVKTFVAGNSSCNISLQIGTQSDDATSFKKIADLTKATGYDPSQTETTVVTIEEDGVYHFAFLGITTNQYAPDNLYIFSFQLDKEGQTPPDPQPEIPETIPYNINLTTTNKGWTALDTDGDGTTWTYYQNMGASADRANPNTSDDYVSPAFVLEASKQYNITTTITGMPTEANEHLLLMTGTAKEGSNMTEINKLLITDFGPNTSVTNFSPQTSGTYYFSIRNTFSQSNNVLTFSSFKIEEENIIVDDDAPIYSNDFSQNSMEGWTATDANLDKIGWEIIDGIKGITYNGENATGAADDWLFSPALPLKAGKDYLIKYTLVQNSAFENDKLEIKLGTEPAPKQMNNLLVTENIESTEGYTTISHICRISCTQNGDYYLGLHICTPNPNGKLSLTAIEIIPAAKATPRPATNLEILRDHTQGTVTLKWINPAMDTENVLINSPMQIHITANNLPIKTLENMKAGETAEYTYKPENLTGTVTYKITAQIGDNHSEPVESTINLDDIDGDRIAINQFDLQNIEQFNAWKVENRNGGITWEYNYGSADIGYGRHDDWFISPKLTLETGQRYVIQFEMFSSMNYPADFELTIGNAQTASSQTTVLQSYMGIEQNGFAMYESKQFSVAANGTYHIAFHVTNVKNRFGIRNIKVCYIGKSLAPTQLPYIQNFDQTETLPQDWKSISQETGFQIVKSETIAYSQPNVLYLANNSTNPQSDYIFTPKFTLTQGFDYDLSFMLQMPGLTVNKQSLSIYTASDQRVASLSEKPFYIQTGSTINTWEEQHAVFTPTTTGDYIFAIKVTSEQANAGHVVIDNFNVSEIVNLAIPAPPMNLQGQRLEGNKVEIWWNNPHLDKEGKQLPAKTVIKTIVYEGDKKIGEMSGEIMELMSLEYEYTNPTEFCGQKIYKAIAYIEDRQSDANTALVTISSLSDGMLTQTIINDNFDSEQNWVIIDNDKDEKKWTIDTVEKTAYTEGSDDWLISPTYTLEKGSRYYMTCEIETNANDGANVEFTMGQGQAIENHKEIIGSYPKLTLDESRKLEVGKVFEATYTDVNFGIHITRNTSTVIVKRIQLIRVFTENDPETIPFIEDFEKKDNINANTSFYNKWGRESSIQSTYYRFLVSNMEQEHSIKANSGDIALVANECAWGERYEVLYTPFFEFQKGKNYEISYYLYMPGNNGINTMAGVFASPTHDLADMEQEVLHQVTQPTKEWTKFSFLYKVTEDCKRCFFFNFIAQEANAGLIAFDDFSIEEKAVSIDSKPTTGAYFIATTSTLILPQDAVAFTIYDAQGRLIMYETVNTSSINLASLANGFYYIHIQNDNGQIQVIKIIR